MRARGGAGLDWSRNVEFGELLGGGGGVTDALNIFFSLSIIAAVMVWYRRFHKLPLNFV